MDQHTDTDFLKLSNQVRDGFEANTVEHSAIMELATNHTLRIDQTERETSALNRLCLENEKSNSMLKQILLGSVDGKVVGCREVQRDQARFLKGIKRGAWVIATAVTAAAIAWVVQVVNHVAVN